MKTVQIEVPDELLDSRNVSEIQSLAQEALLVRLYELGEISSGCAAESLGISRREFLDLLGQYGVSSFDEDADLAAEARRGRE
jgi:predicted HTH domain antitoxin